MSAGQQIHPIETQRVSNLVERLFSIDYRSLAAMRIVMGCTVIGVAYIWAQDFGLFFSEQGVLPLEDLRRFFPSHRFTPLAYATWTGLAWLMLGVLVLSALALVAGYRARVSAAVCFLTYLAFVGRNPVIAQGGDTLLPLLLLWAAFLPTGRAFGIDGALERDRDLKANPTLFSIATIGLLLQVLYVYFFGALLKTAGFWSPNYQAVFMALHIDSMATPLAHFLRNFGVVTVFLTLFVFLIEVFAPVLLFFPDPKMRVRTITLGLLMMMHLGFRAFLNIGHFWASSLSSLMAYVPSHVWNSVGDRYWSDDQRRIKIFYDEDCGFCLKTCLVLREFFLPSEVQIAPAQQTPAMGALLTRENSWVVVTGEGETLFHWDALSFVTKQSPVMRPFWLPVWLLGAIGVGKPLYGKIGNSRRSLSKITAVALPYNVGPRPMGRLSSAVAAVIIVGCLFLNIEENKPENDRSFVYEQIHPVMSKAGLSQRWSMFAPFPAIIDGYPRFTVTDANGVSYFVGRAGELSETPDIPNRLESYYTSYRWRKYYNRIAVYDDDLRAASFARVASTVCASARRTGAPVGVYPASISIEWLSNRSFRQREDEYTVETIGDWPCAH